MEQAQTIEVRTHWELEVYLEIHGLTTPDEIVYEGKGPFRVELAGKAFEVEQPFERGLGRGSSRCLTPQQLWTHAQALAARPAEGAERLRALERASSLAEQALRDPGPDYGELEPVVRTHLREWMIESTGLMNEAEPSPERTLAALDADAKRAEAAGDASKAEVALWILMRRADAMGFQPARVAARVRLARQLSRQRRSPEAMELLDEALRLAGSNPRSMADVHMERGEVHLRESRGGPAIAELEAARDFFACVGSSDGELRANQALASAEASLAREAAPIAALLEVFAAGVPRSHLRDYSLEALHRLANEYASAVRGLVADPTLSRAWSSPAAETDEARWLFEQGGDVLARVRSSPGLLRSMYDADFEALDHAIDLEVDRRYRAQEREAR